MDMDMDMDMELLPLIRTGRNIHSLALLSFWVVNNG
jgi:hypothetical protein